MNFLEKYGITIKNQDLLVTALTHSSFSNENNTESYERLEFLGDAVLQVLLSEYLYTNSSEKEGIMSKERASYVREEALAIYVKEIGFDKYIRVGHGLLGHINDTIIADCFESVLAVIYLEHGLDVCREYINKVIVPHIQHNDIFSNDYKTRLQELVQTSKKSVEYIVVESYGKAHDMTFKVNVVVDNIVLGTGIGHSKKEAEQNAACEALKKSAR